MKDYKTGELAKLANVSIRTIRYYDSIGLLTPTNIAENGYRGYTEGDYLKLQKILLLKYLGFSLADIFSMTVNDSYLSIQDALKMQAKLIEQKIDQLKKIGISLNQTSILIANDEEIIDWPNILKVIKINELEHDLVEQYKNASNVAIRINLHDKYSYNPLSWYEWLYQQYSLIPESIVLELGCGNGHLWYKNKTSLPDNLELVLSDISEGMLIDAKGKLIDIDKITYHQFDCQQIPYPNQSFDVVIANHVLFYLKDLDKTLTEVYRVLKPGGIFYCSTYGKKHMKEITEIVKEYDPRIALSKINLYEVFGLDDGKDILNKYFDEVKKSKYDDYLLVSNKDDLINYILSCHGNQKEYIFKNYPEFNKFINNKFKNNKVIKISKDSGLFIAKKD